ncbi:MAG TPA: CPBP family glutamic-type intramembrane protease [Calidithermus sp.]|nr:CPBP family glutamic-type intramembrane protease [Calidithermus sp.]
MRGRALLEGTPWGLLGLLGATLGVVVVLTGRGWLPPASLGPVAVGAVHGGLLSIALGWAAAGRGWNATVAALGLIGALVLAAAGSRADGRLAALYLVTPALLFRLARAGRLTPVGLEPRVRWRPLALGVAAGGALAVHLLLATGGTFGYRLRFGPGTLVAVAYDLGANVPSGELFFRGALANRLQRRYSLGVAAVGSTGASLVRYLLDPQLPRAPEVLLGAVLYLSVLGVLNTWLLWRSGSVLPGAGAAAVFFAAYRLITPV